MEAEAIDKYVRQRGLVSLVNFAGTRIMFYPKGKLTNEIACYLNAQNGRRLTLLRDFIISQARLGTV